MKKRRTFIILGIVVILIAASGVYFATRQQATNQSGLSQFLANAQQAKVVRTNLKTSVDTSGSVIPATTVQLSFGASGTVSDLKVKVGDQVKKGQVLAVLDPTDLQLKVTQAQQAYLAQQVTYSNTVQADPTQVMSAQASYNSAVAAYSSALRNYSNLGLQQTTQCAQLTNAQNTLNQAQTAYDRLANDHQAKNYLNADWGPFQSVVKALTDAQSAYDVALANCNIAKTSLNDSSVQAAQAQAQAAKTTLDNLISPRVEKQTQAAAQLEQSRLALVQAQQNLANATLTAPFDGVVTAVNIALGSNGGASDAVELADNSQLHVDALVDETQIAGVKPGQETQLTLDSMPGVTLTGKVASIDPAGTISQGVVNYNVRINLDPTNVPVRIDMTANASIVEATHDNVLAVPNAAIRTGGFGGGNRQGGQAGTNIQIGQTVTNTQQNVQSGQQRIQGSSVLVLRNGQPVPVPVTVGLQTADLTEVSGNLQEGDVVLIVTATRTANAGGGGFPGGFGGFPGGGRFGD